MKKLIMVGLLIFLLSGCIGFIACDNGKEEVTKESAPTTGQPSQSQTSDQSSQSQNEATTPSTSTGADITWDLPLVAGFTVVEKGNWSVPPAPGTWSKMEWRYYKYYTPPFMLAKFYKEDELPDAGWAEQMWMETEEVKWGYWTKNNDSDVAMIWIMWEGGDETYLAIMRGTS